MDEQDTSYFIHTCAELLSLLARHRSHRGSSLLPCFAAGDRTLLLCVCLCTMEGCKACFLQGSSRTSWLSFLSEQHDKHSLVLNSALEKVLWTSFLLLLKIKAHCKSSHNVHSSSISPAASPMDWAGGRGNCCGSWSSCMGLPRAVGSVAGSPCA